MKVVIIGAGIIGAALAYALSRQGAQVTVVDGAGPAAGATGASFGWVNASFYLNAAHFALRAEGIAAYRRLCRDLDLPLRWSGCLCWEQTGAALTQQAADLRALGYDVEELTARDLRAREPQLAVARDALYFAQEAAAEPAALTRALLAASGCAVISGVEVEQIVLAGEQVAGVRLPGGVLTCDRVVVAAGTGSPELLAPLGVALPMLTRPGVIVETQVVPPVLSHVCVAPIGEFRQLPSGRLTLPTAVAHQADETETLAAHPGALGAAAVSRLQDLLPDVLLKAEITHLAARPVPQDGLPVVGACGPRGLYTAVMHSGVTLAPLVAEILAAQIMDRLTAAQAEMIASYAPARFQSG